MSLALPTFDYITARVRPLNERLHELVALELAGTITPEQTDELDTLCATLEGETYTKPVSVPVIPAEHLEFLMEGKRA